MGLTNTAAHVAEVSRLAFSIADRACVDDIRSLAHQTSERGWYDTAPMFDEREHTPTSIDMATQALQYALHRGLVVRHAYVPNWVAFARDL